MKKKSLANRMKAFSILSVLGMEKFQKSEYRKAFYAIKGCGLADLIRESCPEVRTTIHLSINSGGKPVAPENEVENQLQLEVKELLTNYYSNTEEELCGN